MSDPSAAAVDQPKRLPEHVDRFSVPAIVTYVVLGQVTFLMIGIFVLILSSAKVEPVMLSVLGGIIAAIIGFANLGIGYWLGSAVSSKTAQAALAQLAGAGPQPPLQADPAKGG